jgi:glycosyltransferase involved in cell wall biosynthesis
MKKIKKNLINKITKNPFFSIITVVKNNENQIVQTILSVSNQTYKNFEYLIIDGKSTDSTISNILKFKKNINYLSSNKDQGIYYAMNKGIKISNGKIILFVNSGDTLKPNALKYVKRLFDSDQNVDFVFGTVKRNYTKSTILKYGYDKNRLFYNFDFATAHSTGFFLKKDIFKKVGNFNTKFKCSADYDLYYRVLIKEKCIGSYTKKSQLIGEVSSGGYSSKISFLEHLKEEFRIRIHNKQNVIFVSLIFLNSVLKNFFK